MNKVYIFDTETREFLGEEDVFLCPITEGPLLPTNGTFLPPPQNIPPNHVPVFRNNTWELVDDFRGQRKFDPQTKRISTVTAIGPLPQTHVIIPKATEREYLEHPDHFVVTDNIYRLGEDEISKMEVRKKRDRKSHERRNMFATADWRMQRAVDTGDADDISRIREYRNYLRDFTNNDNWWEIPILSLDEFNNNNNGERE